MGKAKEKYFQYQQPKFQKPSKNKKKPLKVTYISNPTLVRVADASEFRAVVQELTGKNSKIVDVWDPSTLAFQEPKYETPVLKVDTESVDDGDFSNINSSSSFENEDAIFWKNVSECFFEFQSHSVLCD